MLYCVFIFIFDKSNFVNPTFPIWILSVVGYGYISGRKIEILILPPILYYITDCVQCIALYIHLIFTYNKRICISCTTHKKKHK